jgi:hypothetical protein
VDETTSIIGRNDRAVGRHGLAEILIIVFRP